ncbi:gliding motility lipoprotein GldH [Formosa algae]|uniref:Gliding motility-associated lipoprotein GldH n=1 Tax=Formosa algae TaxID=225843 RepID=A0A9X0YJZ1_9FLAO|nr:gliding motility lipoprotein GldH [Formosa algae]MBP1838544.1 gliding motility-associated lipoprotein GldH [Formosa algae]MDQ0335044.1 gliding motility-associated lipoprotein GldH [Formosa algae]OEI79618.1 gliding motility lipoprotein GldH [Formosa algae]
MQNSSAILVLLGLFFVMTSCDSNQMFDAYKSVPGSWNKEQVVEFNFTPPDTTNAYNLFINVRNDDAYKYSNLFLIVGMEFPHGKTITDTLEYKMAKPNGEFLGEGFNSIKENKLWYKEGFILNESGTYTVSIQQAMRESGKVNGVTNLEGITDVGFRIEKPSTH